LPVLYNGKIEGILSMTDVTMANTFKNADISSMRVLDAYTPNPIKVSPEAPVDEVCRKMASEKVGCVIVEDNGHLVGVFTWIDALEAMDKLLHTRLA
jgi:CBS domain-containing protein